MRRAPAARDDRGGAASRTTRTGKRRGERLLRDGAFERIAQRSFAMRPQYQQASLRLRRAVENDPCGISRMHREVRSASGPPPRRTDPHLHIRRGRLERLLQRLLRSPGPPRAQRQIRVQLVRENSSALDRRVALGQKIGCTENSHFHLQHLFFCAGSPSALAYTSRAGISGCSTGGSTLSIRRRRSPPGICHSTSSPAR